MRCENKKSDIRRKLLRAKINDQSFAENVAIMRR